MNLTLSLYVYDPFQQNLLPCSLQFLRHSQAAHHLADAIMGVNFFGEIAPDDFGSYDLAFVTVFSMTAGNSWVR
jgi:hypothetical protein